MHGEKQKPTQCFWTVALFCDNWDAWKTWKQESLETQGFQLVLFKGFSFFLGSVCLAQTKMGWKKMIWKPTCRESDATFSHDQDSSSSLLEELWLMLMGKMMYV